MAKTFFYDNFDLEGATIDAGSFSSTTYTSSPTRVTGENKIKTKDNPYKSDKK